MTVDMGVIAITGFGWTFFFLGEAFCSYRHITVGHAILGCLYSHQVSNFIDPILDVFFLFFLFILCLFKFLSCDIGWVPPIALGRGFDVCTLFSNP